MRTGVYPCWRELELHEKTASHRCSLLPQPLWISLILAVQIHFLGTEGHAAVAVEIKAVVSADVSPLLLQLTIFSFKEFRKTRFGPFGPGGHGEGNRTEVSPLISRALPIKSKCLLLYWLREPGWSGFKTLGATKLPANQYVCDRGPLHWAVAAESKAGLTVDVLRVADIRAIVALVDGNIYSGSFRVRLQNK